jgi:hypothetical protein
MLFGKIVDELKKECPFIQTDNRTLIKAERYAFYLTILKAIREEFFSPIDPWSGEKNPKYDVPWKPAFVLDLAPRLFSTASTTAHAVTLISEELINPWHHEVLNYCYSNTTGYTQFISALGHYQQSHPTQKLPFCDKLETTDSRPDAKKYYIESGLNIPRELFLVSEGQSTPIFDNACFPKYRDNLKNVDYVNLNYIVLESKVPHNISTEDVINHFISRIKGSMSTSAEILKGIFVKLMEGTTAVEQFEPVLEEDIRALIADETKPFLRAVKSEKKKRLELEVAIISVSISKDKQINQLQVEIDKLIRKANGEESPKSFKKEKSLSLLSLID